MPNEVKLFGCGQKIIIKGSSRCGIYMFTQDINIAKSHVKAIDQPTRRCNSETTNPDTTACLANFIEREIACSPNIQGSQYPIGVSCTTEQQLHDLANITRIFQDADENEIYELTGCLSACEKDLYSVTADPMKKEFQGFSTGCEYHVKFKIMDRSYEEQEQYIIYDSDSFFADLGGFMGLLLGTSLISIYKGLEDLLRKLLYRSTRVG